MRARHIVWLVLCACSAGSTDGTSLAPEPKATPTPATPSAPKASITVASYNINAGMGGNDETLDAALRLDADIIVLQEVTRSWWKLLKDRPGYPYQELDLDPRHHYGGLAILSKFPILSSQVLNDGPGPFIAWRGQLQTPIGSVQVVNVHLFPPVVWFQKRGIMRAYRDSQKRHVKELRAHAARLGDGPTIIAGDFNESRGGDGVQWLIERGFTTAHEGREATWRWKMRGGAEVEFQLDHVMLRGLRASAAAVRKEGASDHYPITATVSLAE